MFPKFSFMTSTGASVLGKGLVNVQKAMCVPPWAYRNVTITGHPVSQKAGKYPQSAASIPLQEKTRASFSAHSSSQAWARKAALHEKIETERAHGAPASGEQLVYNVWMEQPALSAY